MDTPQLTADQQNDVNARSTEFMKRHLANVAELQIDFTAYPQYAQIGPNLYGTSMGMHMVDKRYMPILSPFADLLNSGEPPL